MTESSPDKLYDDARKLKDQGDLEGCVKATVSPDSKRRRRRTQHLLFEWG